MLTDYEKAHLKKIIENGVVVDEKLKKFHREWSAKRVMILDAINSLKRDHK